MDLVNSVTQNSNNRNVTMENQGDGEGNNDNNSSNNNFNKSNSTIKSERHEMAAVDAAPSGQQSSMQTNAMQQQQQQVTSGETAKKSQVPDYLKAIGMDPRKFWPKKYRFTREKSPGQHNPLTIAQRNFYEANGYIVLDDCASKRLLDTIRSQHRESGALINEFLMEKLLMRNGKLIQYVKCFCDERLMLMTHRLVDNFQAQTTTTTTMGQQDDANNKMMKTSHQLARELIDQNQQLKQLLFRDWVYLPFRPIDKVCCAMTAIEPLEHVMLIVPGTHRVGQVTISSTLDTISAAYESSNDRSAPAREIFECSPEKLSSLVDKSKRGFKYVNLKPGQTLIYHPGLIHGFSSDLVNFRKSQLVSVAYYAAADCEYVDLRKSMDELNKQQVPISLAHFNDKHPADYTAWLDKPKLLTDNKANL